MSLPARVSTCVHCRQMKVKCDAKEVFPAPCARCKKHNLTCSIDPLFQRTAKRKRADALEQELREIKATRPHSPRVLGSVNVDATSLSPATSNTIASLPPLSASLSTYPEYSLRISSATFATQQIGEIEISPTAIADILNCYFTKYHDGFPVLPETSIFQRGYDRCPLLFWVLIAVASKSLESYSHYHSALEPHIQRLATDIFSAADHPLGTVQALLILCWWPFSFHAQRNDPSWTYCGLAVHTALRFGLHRPHHFSDFVYNDSLDTPGIAAFTRAWVGCFIVNQNISSEMGVPCTVSPDTTILNAMNSQGIELPKVLVQHLRIAHHSYNICQTLGNNTATTSGLIQGQVGMMRIYEATLHNLESGLSSDLHPYTEMAFLRTKLQLYSFAFSDASIQAYQNGTGSEAAAYWIQASLNAIRVIEVAGKNASQSSWPAIVRASVIYAAHILLRACALSGNQRNQEAKNALRQAWTLLNARSELQHDSWSRRCEIIAYLSQADNEVGNTSTMPVQSRMSANIVYESVWKARGRFSEDVRNSRPSDYTAAAAVRDLFQFGLDFSFGQEFLEEVFPEPFSARDNETNGLP